MSTEKIFIFFFLSYYPNFLRFCSLCCKRGPVTHVEVKHWPTINKEISLYKNENEGGIIETYANV